MTLACACAQGCGEGENAAADAQKHLTKLLADAPAIDKEAMDKVSTLCDDENKLVRQVCSWVCACVRPCV